MGKIGSSKIGSSVLGKVERGAVALTPDKIVGLTLIGAYTDAKEIYTMAKRIVKQRHLHVKIKLSEPLPDKTVEFFITGAIKDVSELASALEHMGKHVVKKFG